MEEAPKQSLSKFLTAPGFKLSQKGINAVQMRVLPIFTEIYQLPENNNSYAPKKGYFLGAHPLSLEKASLKEICTEPYDFLVCEKTDGVRYIMIITNDGSVILSGRDNDYYMVNFPTIAPKEYEDEDDAPETEVTYIFDGELVIDKKYDKEYLTYLFFDCMLFNKEKVYAKKYNERLRFCLQFLNVRQNAFEYFTKTKQKDKIYVVEKAEDFPKIQGYLKDFYPIEQSANIIKNIVPVLPHENDGLIYTRDSKPYPVGPTRSIIKWKPAHLNTIDFVAVNNIAWSDEFDNTILDLYVMQNKQGSDEKELIYFDFMVCSREIFKEIADVTGIYEPGDDMMYKNNEEDRKVCILECKYSQEYEDATLKKMLDKYLKNSEDFTTKLIEDSVLCNDMANNDQIRNNLSTIFDRKLKTMKGNWKMFRKRTDKNTPNAFGTAQNVFKCIFENITLPDLEKAISTINYQQVHMHQMQMQMQQQQQQQQQQNDNIKRHNDHDLEDEKMTKKVKGY